MRVKTSRDFYDTLEDVYRHSGDEFEVSTDRYIELNNKVSGFVSAVEDKEEANTIPLDNLTANELKDLLKAQNIAYDNKASKEDLKALLQK